MNITVRHIDQGVRAISHLKESRCHTDFIHSNMLLLYLYIFTVASPKFAFPNSWNM